MYGRCLICRSKNVSKKNMPLPEEGQILALAVCNDCGFASRVGGREMTSNLAIQESFFETHVKYPNTRNIKWPHRLALVASEVMRLAGNKGKVLDIGCNTGMWLASLGSGWEKHGVEISPSAASIAREFANAEINCCPVEDYELKPEFFDLITAFALIEHVSNPRSLIRWANTCLKLRGYLVLMTGDRESKTALQMGHHWPLYHPIEHVHFFSSRSLCRLVEEEGFRVLRQEWRFMAHREPGVLTSLICWVRKIQEILRMTTFPTNDHFYLYAQKVSSCN